MPIQFERQSLYEEVWSEPLTRLGKKYGLSDSQLIISNDGLSIHANTFIVVPIVY